MALRPFPPKLVVPPLRTPLSGVSSDDVDEDDYGATTCLVNIVVDSVQAKRRVKAAEKLLREKDDRSDEEDNNHADDDLLLPGNNK